MKSAFDDGVTGARPTNSAGTPQDFQDALIQMIRESGQEGVSDEELKEVLDEEIDRLQTYVKDTKPDDFSPSLVLQQFEPGGPALVEFVWRDYEAEKYKAVTLAAQQAAKGPGVFAATFTAQAWFWLEQSPGDAEKYAAAGLSKPSQKPDRVEGIVIAVMAYDGRTTGATFRVHRAKQKGRRRPIVALTIYQSLGESQVLKSGLLSRFWEAYYDARMGTQSSKSH